MLKHKFENDTLGRELIAKKYAEFIIGVEGNHTIALDAPWGSGKTKVIDFICEELDNKKEIYLNYNAWENDYTNEPFLSLMSVFFDDIKEKKYTTSQFENIKKYAFESVKTKTPAVLKGLAKKFLGDETIDAISGDNKELLLDVSTFAIDETFKALSKSNDSRRKFTEELKKSVQQILVKKQKKKFIIIIDELDRCKPTFAIELLENIKHLFNIEEITFLIAVDKEQLAESIKSVYGTGFDANTYLYRFFDFELHLSINSNTSFFSTKLYSMFNASHGITDAINYAVKSFDLTLRDFERIISETYLILILNQFDPRQDNRLAMQFILLLILKYKHNDAYYILEDSQGMEFNEIKSNLGKLDDYLILYNYLNFKANLLFSGTANNEVDTPFNAETNQCFKLIRSTL